MEKAGPKERIPYSVRKGRRQAKQAEEGKVLTTSVDTSVSRVQENKEEKKKDTRAYVVEVQIPVTPEPIVLQSKFPIEESAVMNFSQPAGPEPVVDNGPVKAETISSVRTVQPTDPPEPVVVKQAPPAELEPVKETLVTGPDTATVVEALPAQPKPVMIEEAPLGKSEHTVEEAKKPVKVEVITAKVEDEVFAIPIIKEEKMSVHTVVEKEPAPPPPPPKMEAPSAPVDWENVEIIPAATRLKVLDLIYWRDVKKTGVVFGSMLFILLSLAIFSVLSVIAYLSLAILSVTLSFRVYKNIMQAVQKSGEGHPFKEYLEWDIELNDAKTQKVVKLVMKHFNATVRELRRLFLVEDLVDSIKFGLLLWVLTYIGSWFNGMTLIINSVVIVFTLPKIYETYKVQIDNYLAMARSQFNKILQQVQSKLPFLKKKAKAQ